MADKTIQPQVMQVGDNNVVHYCNHGTAPDTTSTSTQTSLKMPAFNFLVEKDRLVAKDMYGKDTEVKIGDTLWVGKTQQNMEPNIANAIYIGNAVCACVRGNTVVKERLYTRPYHKATVKFKPTVDVYNGETAARRAREKLNQVFTEASSEDFVSWCYTGSARAKACPSL